MLHKAYDVERVLNLESYPAGIWEKDDEFLDIDYVLSSSNMFGPVTYSCITVLGILVTV